MSEVLKVSKKPSLPKFLRVVRKPLVARVNSMLQIIGPAFALELLGEMLIVEQVEVMLVAMLDSARRVVGIVEVSRGELDSANVGMRVVFQLPVLYVASAIVTAHNHPSGDVTPSPADRATWRRIEHAGALFGIAVFDHLIVGTDPMSGYRKVFSASEAGLIKTQ